jgi:hypothetical protein
MVVNNTFHLRHENICRYVLISSLGPRYIGDDFFLGPNLVSFNHQTVVPYEISKVNFRVETKILVSMSRDLIN